MIWIQVHNNKTLGERNTFTKKRGCANCTKIYMRKHAIFDLHEKFYGTYNTTINPWGDVQWHISRVGVVERSEKKDICLFHVFPSNHVFLLLMSFLRFPAFGERLFG